MNKLNKYFAYFILEINRLPIFLGNLFTRIVLIFIRVSLSYYLFIAMEKAGTIKGDQLNMLMWAILLGQIVYGSTMRLHENIRNDIRSGDISIRITEPKSYSLGKLFQALGFFLPRVILYSIICVPFATIFFPISFDVYSLIFYIVLSFFLTTSINLILGLISFIVENNEGLYWIVSKLYFIFGNQVIPMALMPVAVVKFAQLTPFFLGFAGPIEIVSGRASTLQSTLLYFFYIFIFISSAILLENKIRKNLIING